MSSFGVFYRPTVRLFVIFPQENRSLLGGKCRYWPGWGNTKRKPRASTLLLQFLSYSYLGLLSQDVSSNEHYKISRVFFVLITVHRLVTSHFVTYKFIKIVKRITIIKVIIYRSNLYLQFLLCVIYWAIIRRWVIQCWCFHVHKQIFINFNRYLQFYGQVKLAQ